MKIQDIEVYSGKNYYTHKPAIKMIIDLGIYVEKPTKEFDKFNEILINIFPGLKNHFCSRGYEGGFLERLEEGTYIGHVIEHMIIEIQNVLGYEVNYGKTRILGEPSTYLIIFEYKNEELAIETAKTAVDLVLKIINKENFDIQTILHRLKHISIKSELGPSTKAIYDEAVRRGIPVSRMGSSSILQLGYGKNLRYMEAALSDYPNCISVDIASNKSITKKILEDNGIPVPIGKIAYSLESAIQTANLLGYPVVIKPLDQSQGRGVSVGLMTDQQVINAYDEASKHGWKVLVEEYVEGKDYRILVVGNKVVAVAEKIPTSIIGDGVRSIERLVEIENENPLRGQGHEKPLTKIIIDEIVLKELAERNISKEYIPVEGEIVFLRRNGNLSTGATAIDCTEKIHPLNCELAIKAAKVIGLDIAGIDIITSDISVPLKSTKGAVIEVNACPGLRMHLYTQNKYNPRVAKEIINLLYPSDERSRIPIISVTGTNGKTTTVRLIAHCLELLGNTVGMTSTTGVYIGQERILHGDSAGPISAKLVLGNKNVDVAVLETARGGIVKWGLGYDFADVGVITNISEDHIGVDAVNTIEDLAFAKSLVIEAVSPNGSSILNADDPMVEYFMNRASGNIILFSKKINNPLIMHHIDVGKKTVFASDDSIFYYDGQQTIKIIDISDIPLTFNGMLECNIENSLASISSLCAIGVPIDYIIKALQSFKPDYVLNPGRFNIIDFGEFKVMLDYCHNIGGHQEVIKFLDKIENQRMVGVIGMPGDRDDEIIREVGRLCAAKFSKIYIKEDSNLRNRDAGEVAGILYDCIMREGVNKNDVKVIYSETKALETAILEAEPKDFIVMFYENFDLALEVTLKMKEKFDYEQISYEISVDQTAG